ncbi:hypothetical protein HII28_15025 [Planctomonas sp. JC2975]|uniref:hypothetical protein n=1 Tax=Planctomonas sp. JC2975 TaxID=2729626 RepID=UPI001474FC8F|nr:hypothetical protein [Planctomonas sp. JC2975]NNC13186.1 hypothetical protein [Planctomonas sp. JC2975]
MSGPMPSSARRPAARRMRLALLLITRGIRRARLRLALFSGWVWVAAASLVGFEVLEILLGALLAAPEVLPLVLLALAAVWYFRRALVRLWRRLSSRERSR